MTRSSRRPPRRFGRHSRRGEEQRGNRAAYLEALRRRVQSGTYRVNVAVLADCILAARAA